MSRTTVLQPGQICSVRVSPSPSGAALTLEVEDRDRKGDATALHKWNSDQLLHGVRWKLLSGHTYTLRLILEERADSEVGASETGESERDDCRVRIHFVSDSGKERSFIDELLSEADREWTIVASGSHAEDGRREGLGGGRPTLGFGGRGSGMRGFGMTRGSRDRPDEREPEEPRIGGGARASRDREVPANGGGARRSRDREVPADSGGARGSRDRGEPRIGGGADGPEEAVGPEPEAPEPEADGWESLARGSRTAPQPGSKAKVSTGFSLQTEPDGYVDKKLPLLLSGDYYFWFEVGEKRAAGAVDRETTPLDVKGMSEGTRLDVVLFAFEGEFGIEPDRDVGILELCGAEDSHGERAVKVHRQVVTPKDLADPEVLTRRLFFPVRMPPEAGTHRLRCNVYYQQVLLQSRLVSVEVAADPKPRDRQVLETVVDYRISKQLRSELFESIKKHSLSIMLNDNGNGTHGFRFYGGTDDDPFKNEASLLGPELTKKIRNGRRQLRRVAWGSPDEWDGKPGSYRYDDKRPTENLKKLKQDLVGLARAGFRMYDDVASRLAEQPGVDARPARWALEDLMLPTGRVQIAAKSSAKHVVPAALFYDYRFSDGGDPANFTLCPVFEDALQNGKALLETACFKGECPTRKDKYVVCPSGFWGFRHKVGFPTIENRDAALSIPYEGRPQMLVAVSTDQNLLQRGPHEAKLKEMVEASAWHHAPDTAQAYDLMREDDAQVVYFYCHGGKAADDTPYLEIGPRGNPQVITKGELSNERIYWPKHPPLVFINGCHTTAVDPESASDLVSGFRESNAVGVIGTEITIFESLACAMAESFFGYFLDGREVGDALRRARIDLLQKGNPLGLVYIPFVLASVQLRESA